MTGEEAAVTLVSHEFEEEVELWLHHFNSTNPSQLRHLVESVAVYLRMCGDDKDVEEFTRKVEEFASMGTWNQTDAETMAFLLNYVENQCQLETGSDWLGGGWAIFFCFLNPLALLSKWTDIVLGWDTTRRPLIWTFWWRKLASRTPTIHAATLCNWQWPMSHQARTKRSLRIEKLPDGSVYASSLHRDGYCSSHFKLVEKQPDHWISKSNLVRYQRFSFGVNRVPQPSSHLENVFFLFRDERMIVCKQYCIIRWSAHVDRCSSDISK